MALQLSIDDTRKNEYTYYDRGDTAAPTKKMTNDVHVALSVISDYNFAKGHNINPFAGVGLGYGLPSSLLFQPRVGVEFSGHHRVTLSSHIGFGSTGVDNWSKRLTNLRLTYGYTF